MTSESTAFPVRRATPSETLGSASPTPLPSALGPSPSVPSKPAVANAGDNKMVTKRSVRSFVEEGLAAERRECRQQQQLLQASKTAGAMDTSPVAIAEGASTGASSSLLNDLPPISTGRCPTILTSPGAERRPTLSSSNSSSRMSITSSLYSTSSSMASDILAGNVADSDDVLGEEPSSPGLAPDGQPLPDGAPHNWGTVIPGLYRSSYPRPENYDFIQTLGLKTIVTLVDKNFTEEYRDFMTTNHIQHHIIRMKGTKKEEIPLDIMKAILTLVLDHKNYPMMIHCNHGKHRTGCVVAVVRKVAGWDSSRAIGEYKAYAGSKMRDCDVNYIANFKLASIPDLVASCNLDFSDSSSSGSSIAEKANGVTGSQRVDVPSTRRFRVPNFLRATVFSTTVLIIWLISGSKFTAPNRRG